MTFIRMLALFFGIITCAVMGAMLFMDLLSNESVSYYMKIGTKEHPIRQQAIYFAGLLSSLLLIIIILKSDK